jgi:hypothetical protein
MKKLFAFGLDGILAESKSPHPPLITLSARQTVLPEVLPGIDFN